MADFTLFPKQHHAMTTNATKILYGGAVGGGKSHLVRVSSIFFSLAIPNLQTYIFRKTYPELIDNHLSGSSSFHFMLREYVDMGYCNINMSKMEIHFNNGSCIHLRHCSNVQDKWKYSGAEMNYLIVDEAANFEDEILTFLESRVRIGGLQIPEQYKDMFPRQLFTTNPIGVSAWWLKKQYVDIMPEDTVTNNKIYICARLQDNKILLHNDPGYEERLNNLGSPELVKALKEGSWDIQFGAYFAGSFEKEQCVIKPFEIPIGWKVARCYDHGISAPFSVLWVATSNGEEVTVNYQTGETVYFPRGSRIVICEYYGDDGNEKGLGLSATEIAQNIKEYEKKLSKNLYKNNIVPGPADSAIWSKESHKHSVIDAFKKENVNFIKADKSPGSRVRGWQNMIRMFKNCQKKEEDGLYIFNTCPRVIAHISGITADKTNPEDIDTKGLDHDLDALRYGVYQKGGGFSQRSITG